MGRRKRREPKTKWVLMRRVQLAVGVQPMFLHRGTGWTPLADRARAFDSKREAQAAGRPLGDDVVAVKRDDGAAEERTSREARMERTTALAAAVNQ